MKTGILSCLLTGLLGAASLIPVQDLPAQPAIQYRIHWVDIPVSFDDLQVRGINDHRVLTGYWVNDANGSLNGFAYDLSDDSNPEYYDLRSLLGIPMEWVDIWGKHINNHGQGVGNVRDVNGNRRGIWFDMVSAAWGFVPDPVGGEFDQTYGQIHINNGGDISVDLDRPDGTGDVYVYNPDPIDGFVPNYGDFGLDVSGARIADSGHVVGTHILAEPGPVQPLFRWMTSNSTPELLDDQIFHGLGAVNGLGQIVGTYWNSNIQGPGGESSFEVFRYRSSTDFDILPLETGSAKGFNDSGDVVGNLDHGDLRLYAFHSSGPDAFLYQDEWGVIQLDNVVVGNDVEFFRNAEISFGGPAGSVLTNRDSTGFGSILGTAKMTTTTGRGRNRVTTTERRTFVLIPETVDPPSGGSETYEATDIPQGGAMIPDNDPDGVSSMITDVADIPFIVFTLTLDIDHPRPSDLKIWLYPDPDSTDLPVEYSGDTVNLIGDNDVSADFTSSPGDWTLEVYDTRKKKKGTLYGWSITIDTP